jgi:RimJ/RimL family protein N-acetyltransferase
MSTTAEKPANTVSNIKNSEFTLIPFNTSNNSHNEFLVTLWNTPLFITSSGRTGIDTPSKAKAFIERRWIPSYALNGYGTYLISLNSDSDPNFIGTVGLTKGDSPESYTAPDLGFAILPEFNGRGYATRAAKLLLSYVKDELGVIDVFGFCNPKNEGSRRVLEKVGLEFRGLMKLGAFGGVEGAVYAMKWMNENMSVYGVKG